MQLSCVRFGGALGALLMVWGSVQGATVYVYTGNNFNAFIDFPQLAGSYTEAMSVTGSFTVNAPLGPMPLTDISGLVTNFSFSDGRNTNTETNTVATTIQVITDGAGQISDWFISTTSGSTSLTGDQQFTIDTSSLTSSDSGLIEECIADDGATCLGTIFDRGRILNSPGSWSIVPVPAAVWLFGSALSLLGWVRRRTTLIQTAAGSV